MIHFGRGEWDAPVSLHDLLRCDDPRMLAHVPDYRLNLISPSTMGRDDIARFETELGLVLGYIRYMCDKEGLEDLLKSERRYRSVGAESAELVNVLSGSRLKVGSGEEWVDMCQALIDIRQEGVDEGIEKGMQQGMRQGMEQGMQQGMQQGMRQGMLTAFAGLVRDGVLTPAEAAARAGLTPDEFEKQVAAL